ncbi:MAG: response regulator, partial [Bryobacteraceae bacterium]
PGLIVMDLHLPKKDGLEILREIRRTAGFADLPVAIVSSFGSPDEKSQIAALKANFMAKGRDLDECLSIGNKIRQMALGGRVVPRTAAQFLSLACRGTH